MIGEALTNPTHRVKGYSSEVIPFKPRIARVILSDRQKALIKNRIDKDFGQGTWARLPEAFKMSLWLYRHEVPHTADKT